MAKKIEILYSPYEKETLYGEVFSKSARIIEFHRKTKVCGKGIKV